VLGAVHCDGAARVDGRQLLSALRAVVHARGGTWLSGHATLRLEAERVTGVRVDGVAIDADTVVISGGAWSRSLVVPLEIELPVHPQRGQLLHLELPGPSTAGWPMVVGFSTSYLLSFPERRIVAGATREAEVGFDYRPTAGGVHAVLGSALRLAPELARATVKEIRVGFRPSSADGKPILGASARYPNVYFVTGHGGYGLEVGPYSGALVADLIMGEAPPIDLGPFGVDRFRPAPAST
jgi:D-amino-acid dehydrogenase